VLVQDVSVQVEVIRKSLRPGTLTNGHHSGLFWVQNPTLLAHRLGVSHGGGEEPIPGDSAVQAGPVVVPVGGVRQAPGNEGVFLLVWVDALLLARRAVADAAEGSVLGFALVKKFGK